jgi:ubiquinone/menaquinone biosynthesis C-methylase UbiE
MEWVKTRVMHYEKALNIGVGDNGIGFADDVVQFDMDRYQYDKFVQGDAHHLPFKGQSFDVVVISDVLEHVVDPRQVLQEAKRVGRRVVVSIFEEWRLGGPGQHIEKGHAVQIEGMVRRGMTELNNPSNIVGRVSEDTISHNPHIWQFTDDMIRDLIYSTGMKVVEFCKEPECIHLGHMWYNWLIVLKPTVEMVQYPKKPCNYFPESILRREFAQAGVPENQENV